MYLLSMLRRAGQRRFLMFFGLGKFNQQIVASIDQVLEMLAFLKSVGQQGFSQARHLERGIEAPRRCH